MSNVSYDGLNLDNNQKMILDYYLLEECKPQYVAKVLELLSRDDSGSCGAGANVMDLTIRYDSRTVAFDNSIEDGSTPNYKPVELDFSVFEKLLRARLKDMLGE